MPPRTENGANIVAFELDGVPYVFPKEGMQDYPVLMYGPKWICQVEKMKKDGALKNELNWHSWREDKKYNRSYCAIGIDLPIEEEGRVNFQTNGSLELDTWYFQDDEISFVVTKYIPSKELICGRFSGVLKDEVTGDSRRVENGFFDLKYTTTEVY